MPTCRAHDLPQRRLVALTSWVGIMDLFDSAVGLEEQFIKEGYDEGVRWGRSPAACPRMWQRLPAAS